jgi:membrane-associated phospholipid phosphatase
MWSTISDLGDAGLTLPLAIVCAVWLATSGWKPVMLWLTMLGTGMLMVGLTKMFYAGCGVHLPLAEFRVISGHTMLASAVWPMTLLLLFQGRTDGHVRLKVAAGLALAALIGVARVFDGAHTVPEVVVGWCVGAVITVLFVRWQHLPGLLPRWRRLAGVSLLSVSALAYGHHAPIQAAIDSYSSWLCLWF